MLRFIFFLLLFTCTIIDIQAQTVQQKLDSLFKELPKVKEDSNRVLLLCSVSYSYFQLAPDSGILYGKNALALAMQINYIRGMAGANMAIGRCYAAQNQYPDALKHFTEALILTQKIKDYNREVGTLISLGSIYREVQEPDKALEFFLRAKDVSQYAQQDLYTSIMSSIADIYLSKGDHDKALRYYKMCIEHEERKEKPVMASLATLYGSVGTLYFFTEAFAIALPWYFKALALHRQVGNFKSAANMLNSIGFAYYKIAVTPGLKLPDSLSNKKLILQKAIPYLEQSSEICEKIGWIKVLQRATSNLAIVYLELGNYRKAYYYKDLEGILYDSLRNYDEEKKFAKVEAEFAVKKKTDSLKFANTVKDKEIFRKRTERNGTIAVLILVGMTGTLLVNRQKIKSKKLKAEKDLADSKLEKAQQRLDNFTKNLKEKNQLIEKFSIEIERLQALPCSNELPDTKENLIKLQNSIILTEEQWDDFKTTFEDVHAGFLHRLKKNMPDLTPAETRYMALTKLQLSNKEMAGMLGVGDAAVRNYKYRLLKKLNLPADSDINEVVDSI